MMLKRRQPLRLRQSGVSDGDDDDVDEIVVVVGDVFADEAESIWLYTETD